MAENRTFQFMGMGYGTSNVSVTAKINNTVVYSGEIPTVDQTPLSPPTTDALVNIFSINNSAELNTDFAGFLPMSITVTGGNYVIFGDVLSNYSTTPLTDGGGSINMYSTCYYGDPANSDENVDCRSNVYIDGIKQDRNVYPGVGLWVIPTDSTITYEWNVGTGQVGNLRGSGNAIATFN